MAVVWEVCGGVRGSCAGWCGVCRATKKTTSRPMWFFLWSPERVALPPSDSLESTVSPLDYLLRNSSETVSFLRPLARRAAKTLRPFTVAIRARKPCLLILFLFEG